MLEASSPFWGMCHFPILRYVSLPPFSGMCHFPHSQVCVTSPFWDMSLPHSEICVTSPFLRYVSLPHSQVCVTSPFWGMCHFPILRYASLPHSEVCVTSPFWGMCHFPILRFVSLPYSQVRVTSPKCTTKYKEILPPREWWTARSPERRSVEPCVPPFAIVTPQTFHPNLYCFQHALLLCDGLRNFIFSPNVTVAVFLGVILLFEERFLNSITWRHIKMKVNMCTPVLRHHLING